MKPKLVDYSRMYPRPFLSQMLLVYRVYGSTRPSTSIYYPSRQMYAA